MTNIKKVLAIMGMIMLLIACNGKKEKETVNADTKIEITDLKGRKVVLDKLPEKLFLGFYFETYLAVNGSFDNVVSISKGEWSDFFKSQWELYNKSIPTLKNIPDTGSIYLGKFSLENLFNSAPEVAILAPFQYDMLGEAVKKMDDAGIKIIVLDYNSMKLEKHLKSTEILGMVLNKKELAKQLNDEYKDAVDEITKRVEKYKDAKRKVYFELGNLGPKIYGNSYGDFMWGGMVMDAGGNNIAFGKIPKYGPLNPEYVLKENPDVICFAGLYMSDTEKDFIPMGFGVNKDLTINKVKEYLNRPGWQDLNAVKNRKIFITDHAGLRTMYDYIYIQFIAKAIYPESFADIDPVKNHQEFYKKYLPMINLEGNFMMSYGEHIDK